MFRVQNHRLAFGLAVGAALWVVAPADGDSPPAAQASSRLSLDDLVARLGSPDYEERQRATELLKAKDPSVAHELKKIFIRVTDHEVRLRLKEIAEFIFYRQALEEMGGFLGISLQAVDHRDEPRLAEGQAAVRVVEILPRTAAARAGLMPGDLVIGVDGDEIPVTRGDPSKFIQRISEKPPSTRIELTYLRDIDLITQPVVLGLKPLSHIARMRLDDRQEGALERARRHFEQWCDSVSQAPAP